MNVHPPRLFRDLLARSLPEDTVGSSLLGDLHEEYVSLRAGKGRILADLWYGWQSVALSGPWLGRRVWRTLGDRARESTLGLGLDLKRTARGLRRSPGTVLLAVLSLGVGVGLATAAVGLGITSWLPALPYPAADRLMVLEDTHPRHVCATCFVGTSWASYREWQDEASAFESVEAVTVRTMEVGEGESSAHLDVSAVSGGYAGMLDIRPALGRVITRQDEDAGGARVVVLGHRLWADRFGADPEILGRAVRLDGEPYTVVGVLPRDAPDLESSQAWIPLETMLGETDRAYDVRGLMVVARRRAEIDPAAAGEQIAALAARSYAADATLDQDWGAEATSLVEHIRKGSLHPSAWAAMVATGILVLLIASLNLAALLLARVHERTYELGLRAALGSGRARLLRAAVLEALVLAAAGGLAGLWISSVTFGILETRLAGQVPGWLSFDLDVRILGACMGLTLVTALACSLLPFMRAARIDPGELMGRVGSRKGPGHLPRQNLLLGAQVVVGLVLLAGAATSVRSFVRISDFDTLGHRWEGLATVSVEVPEHFRGSGQERVAFAEALAARASREAGIGRVSTMSSVRLRRTGELHSGLRAEGSPEPLLNTLAPRSAHAILPGLLELREIPVVVGRSLGPGDGPESGRVALLSREMARRLWPGERSEAALGRSLFLSDDSAEHGFVVVGVVGDVVEDIGSESRAVTPRIYTSMAQTPASLLEDASVLAVTAEASGAGMRPDAWRAIVGSVDAEARVLYASSTEAILQEWIAPTRIIAGILSGVAILALGLLLMGVYGTLAYRVSSARREIGVRIALGARRHEVVRSITSGVGQVFLWSIPLGGFLAVPVSRALRGGGLPVGSADVLLLATVGALIATVGALGSVLPAARALRTDPVESLREE